MLEQGFKTDIPNKYGNYQDDIHNRKYGEFNNFPILVVDNDRMILRLFDKYLSSWGFKPYLTTDPYEGVSLALKHRPMVIILDVFIPDIDGEIALKLLKKIDITSDIPIILLSTDINLNLLNTALGAGADDFLAKPFSYETLYKKLKRIIKPDFIIQMEALSS